MAVLVVSLGVIIAAIILSTGGSAKTASPTDTENSSAQTSGTTAVQTSGTTAEPTSIGPTATEPTTPSVTPAGIDIAAVAHDARVGRVADLLDRYLVAINQHDASGVTKIYDPAGIVASDTPAGVASWLQDISTTRDDRMRILSIGTDPQTAGRLLVHITFRSQQDPALSVDQVSSCNLWDLTFRFTPYQGGYRVFDSVAVNHSGC